MTAPERACGDSSRPARALALLVPFAIGAGLLLTSTVSLHETAWKFDVKRLLELWLLPLLFGLVLLQPALRQAFRRQLQRTPRWLGSTLLAVLALGMVSAAYNAGSTRVARWDGRAGVRDPEIYAERIPFKETREYVRKIVAQWAAYRRLYGPPPPAS